jgi:hypothetical protein
MMNTVLVFKTSVTTNHKALMVKPVLDNLINNSGRWNFDLEDCDNILRVEANTIHPSVIIEHLEKAGVACVELED